MLKELIRPLIKILAKSDACYDFSRKVVDYHDNLNNCELDSNGELAFLQRNIASFDVIFDVGANVGDWSLLVNKMKPEARLFAFEPVKSTFGTLSCQKFNQNVELQNSGLGAEVGTLDFSVYGADSTLNTAHGRNATELVGAVLEQVKIDTVDNFCVDHQLSSIDFLKIDVEGHELAVLQGAKNMLAEQKIKVVQFEYGGTYIDARILLKDAFELLQGSGYEVYKIHTDKVVKIEKYNQALENFQYANYVAAVKGIEIK